MVILGFAMLLVGQSIRTAAMITAGQSFHHLIQTSKKKNHILITHGIYSVFRHPSYVGFFYWSIGTQIFLGNLIHSILFTIVTWNFFQRRIPYEEESLCTYFPQEYPSYLARTWMGIPFLKSPQTIMIPRSTTTPSPTNNESNSDDATHKKD
jgi:protein-S-isoprenylcysteine O-methyltransferase